MTIHPAQPAFETPGDAAELDWLIGAIRRNRFLPEPPPSSIFVGDGDFRAIGTEFLGHLVRLGGLRPEARVLDIGSGIGRMAVPLTQYLARGATYLGLDPTREGIEWCRRTVTPTYPNFRFRHLDVLHEIYNPRGLLRGESLVLPVGDASIDFAFMISVVTHLPPVEVEVYAREVARLLAPGGRLFVTSFVMDETARTSQAKDHRRGFKRTQTGPDWYVDPAARLGAVAFDEGWLAALLERVGLEVRTVSLGHWRGAPATHYQDVIIAEKPVAERPAAETPDMDAAEDAA